MGTHPNAILVAHLTPDDLPLKTLRAIKADPEVEYNEVLEQAQIDGVWYSLEVLEDDYDEDFQISGKAGDIIVHDFVTYGYGESIGWDKLAAQKDKLAEWCGRICEKRKCSYRIEVTANYW